MLRRRICSLSNGRRGLGARPGAPRTVVSTQNKTARISSPFNGALLYNRTMPIELRSCSTSAGAESTEVAVLLKQVTTAWLEGRLLDAEKRLEFALANAPDNVAVIHQALTLKDVVGSLAEQAQIIDKLHLILAKIASKQVQADPVALEELCFQLKARGSVLAALGVHSHAIKRLDAAVKASKLIPQPAKKTLVADLEKQLTEQKRLFDLRKKDQIFRAAPNRGYTSPSWEAEQDNRFYEIDFQRLLRSAELNHAIANAMDADMDFEHALHMMRDNLAQVKERLQLQSDEAAQSYVASLVNKYAGRLMMRDELSRVEVLLDQSSVFIPNADENIQQARKILKDLKDAQKLMTPMARSVQRPMHAVLWRRLQYLVKQSTGDIVESSIIEEIKRVLTQIATALDPEAALEKTFWAGFPSVKPMLFSRADDAIAELNKLAERASHDGSGPSISAKKRVMAQLEREAEYIKAKTQMVRAAIKDASNQPLTPEERLDAIASANRAIALCGSPTVDGKTLILRSQLYHAAGLLAEAMRDAATAAATYPSDSEIRFGLSVVVRDVEGQDSESAKGLFMDSVAALVCEWQRTRLSGGVLCSRSLPSKDALDKLARDSELLDLLIHVELNPPTPSRAQMSNATAGILYRYAPGNQEAVMQSLDDALKHLKDHFDAANIPEETTREAGRAGILFNMALTKARTVNTLPESVKFLDEAEQIMREQHRQIPPHWERLRKDVTSGRVHQSPYGWAPL